MVLPFPLISNDVTALLSESGSSRRLLQICDHLKRPKCRKLLRLHVRIILHQHLRACRNLVSSAERPLLAYKVGKYRQLLSSQLPLIRDDVIAAGVCEADRALRNDLLLFSELNQPAIEGKDGILILLLRLNIDVCIILRNLLLFIQL